MRVGVGGKLHLPGRPVEGERADLFQLLLLLGKVHELGELAALQRSRRGSLHFQEHVLGRLPLEFHDRLLQVAEDGA